MRYYLMLLTLFFSNLVFSQSFHLFKGPTNDEGTMIILLQERGNNAYYYFLVTTDYYTDMRNMSERDWEEIMSKERPNASILQKTGNNIYTGKFNDRIIWNLKFTYDEYDKTAVTVLTHPEYESNTFNLTEVGLDGYKLAKQKRPASASTKANCWVCNGRGTISVGYPYTGQLPCVTCGGTGTVVFSNQGNIPNDGVPSGGTPSSGGSSSGGTTSSHNCRVCNGTGTEIYEPYTGSGRSVYCNICRRNFSHAHSHRPCKTCNGTGRVSY